MKERSLMHEHLYHDRLDLGISSEKEVGTFVMEIVAIRGRSTDVLTLILIASK